MFRIGLFLILSGIIICSCEKTQTPERADTPNDSVPKHIQVADESFNFFVIGDWGRCGDFNQRKVAEQMSKYVDVFDPEFFISTGDNFYDNGVASIDDPLWMSSFENVYTGSNLQRNWFSILGNHDYKGNPQAQIDYSQKSRRWNMPARYYTFTEEIDDTTSIRFIFIDTNPFVQKYHKEKEAYADLAMQDTTKQLKWLDEVLASSTEKWKIVIGHHPAYSTGDKHGDTKEIIRILTPRMQKHGIQMYLAGHEHDLQHQQPAGGVDYIVSGAGSETRTTSKNEKTKFAEAVSGFAAFSCTADSLKLYFINYKGDMIYSYSRGE
ncbi:MAG: purple acid phosphatase family protein [Cytophaga sp.]|uniref:purple acid phosphatase family protein n=1 Tax=Cytophaga sp. TaxID=29535 RepID=UPI003F7EA200